MTTSGMAQSSISEIYENHPLSAASILRRVRMTAATRIEIREEDLAYDPVYGITDQNHIGGAEFVLAMGELLGLSSGAKVLDLGSGLGGPARLLAQEFGAQVTGVEANEQRCKDAQLLTELTKLRGLCFQHGDFWDVPVKDGSFDVLWGQGTWNHVAEKRHFLERWLPALRAGGRIACEEVFLRPGTAESEKDSGPMEELRRIWQVEFLTSAEWLAIFSALHLEVLAFVDLSHKMEAYCRELAALTRSWSDWPESERTGLEIAATLVSEDVLSCFRTIVRKS